MTDADGDGVSRSDPGAFDPVTFLEDAVPVASDDADGVAEMREFLVETLEAQGVEATVDEAGNVLSSRGPADGSPHLAFNTHIDTVSPHVPYERDGDVIRGRGSCDAKGPLAAILAAFLGVDPNLGSGDEDGDGARLTLAVTPDEETLSTGAAALDVGSDLYVVGEPTGLDVCNAAKGRFQGTVTLRGTAAHAAEPDSGANAVAAVAPVLSALETYDADRDPHPSLGRATLTPTVIEGGESTNQVPAECRLTVDRRSVPPESAAEFRADLEAHLREAVPEDSGVTLDFSLTERETPFLEAFDTPGDHPLVETLADAARRTSDGAGGEVRPFTAATEASYFAPAPVVVFGPGDLADEEGAVAHANREYVRLPEVRAAAAALEDATATLVSERVSE